MDEYNKIVSEFSQLETQKKSLAEAFGKYDFTTIETPKSDNIPGERYVLRQGKKQIGEYEIIIKIETRDSYRSFGNDDDEPYFNTVELWKHGVLVESKGYTYFK